jgi:predicted ester cyclase
MACIHTLEERKKNARLTIGEAFTSYVVKQRLKGLKSGVPSYHAIIDELIVEGETAIMRFHSEGIHTGELFGVPSTGKKIVINGCCVYRMKNGRVVEAFIYNDWLGLLIQLGVVPQLV